MKKMTKDCKKNVLHNLMLIRVKEEYNWLLHNEFLTHKSKEDLYSLAYVIVNGSLSTLFDDWDPYKS